MLYFKEKKREEKKTFHLNKRACLMNIFNFLKFLVTFGMTSTKTYYFTTVLRTVFTERPVEGVGAQPTYDNIANFDDFWNVKSIQFRTFFIQTFSIY